MGTRIGEFLGKYDRKFRVGGIVIVGVMLLSIVLLVVAVNGSTGKCSVRTTGSDAWDAVALNCYQAGQGELLLIWTHPLNKAELHVFFEDAAGIDTGDVLMDIGSWTQIAGYFSKRGTVTKVYVPRVPKDVLWPLIEDMMSGVVMFRVGDSRATIAVSEKKVNEWYGMVSDGTSGAGRQRD